MKHKIPRKWLLLACIVIPFVSGILEAAGKQENDSESVEKRIEALKKELNENHKIEMQKEVDGQGLMIADWKKFAHEMEEVHQLEERDKQIELEIKKLESLKK